MKRVKLKNLIKKLKEQTTPYYGDMDTVIDPPKASDVPHKYDCITIRKPGHISGLEVGDKTCIESLDGEFSSIDECRSSCRDNVSPYTEWDCSMLENWISQNSDPDPQSDALFAGPNIITVDFWCNDLCVLPDVYEDHPKMCSCCEEIECFKCINGSPVGNMYYAFEGCPYGWVENEEDACREEEDEGPDFDLVGTDPEIDDEEDEEEDDDGIDVTGVDVVGTDPEIDDEYDDEDDEEDEDDDGIDVTGVDVVGTDPETDDEEEDEDEDEDDVRPERPLDPDPLDDDEEGEQIVCYMCQDNDQVVAQPFYDLDFCPEDEGWYNTPEEACGDEVKKIRCYRCLWSVENQDNYYIGQLFPSDELENLECPEDEGWYNTPEEAPCKEDITPILGPQEHVCIWCPGIPPVPGTAGSVGIGGTPGYYYLQSPSEGGTHGWNNWDPLDPNSDDDFYDDSNWGEIGYADVGLDSPIPVPQDNQGRGVQQGNGGGNPIGSAGPQCSDYDYSQPVSYNIEKPGHISGLAVGEIFTEHRWPELQQFCLDMGYPDLPPEPWDEGGFDNESDWNEDNIVDPDEPYTGPVSCIWCPGPNAFYPTSVAATGNWDASGIPWNPYGIIFNTAEGNYDCDNNGWWGPAYSNTPTIGGWDMYVNGYTGSPWQMGGGNCGFQWNDTYNSEVAPITNQVSTGYWFLESWNNPGQGWDIEVDGAYPEGVTSTDNGISNITPANCQNSIYGTALPNPYTVIAYFNPDSVAYMPSWAPEYMNPPSSTNTSMQEFCNANGFTELEVGPQLGYTEEDWTGIPQIDPGDCPWPAACNYGDPCPEEYEDECVNNCYWGCDQAQQTFGAYVAMWGFGPCALEIGMGWTEAICCSNCTSGCVGIVDQFNQNWNTIIIEDVIGEQYESLCGTNADIADAAGTTQAYLNYLNQTLSYAQQGITFMPGVSMNSQPGEYIETADEYIDYTNSYINDFVGSDGFTTWS